MTKFDKAAEFAVEKHSGMKRKAGNSPYVLHLFETAAIAGTLTDDEDVLTAAILHDAVEDAGVSPDEIRERFGGRVAELVLSETEDKRRGTPPSDSWRDRKTESLRKLKDADDAGTAIIWLSDKLSNVRSFYRLWLERGDAVWDVTNQKDKKQQEWYYRTVLALLGGLRGTAAWEELKTLVDRLFEGA